MDYIQEDFLSSGITQKITTAMRTSNPAFIHSRYARFIFNRVRCPVHTNILASKIGAFQTYPKKQNGDFLEDGFNDFVQILYGDYITKYKTAQVVSSGE
jgi:hypothetical protein